MSLNAAQADVLTALTDGPKTTSNVTSGDVVSGVASAGLEKRELVTIKSLKDGSRQVKITTAGKKELKAYNA